MVDTVQPGYEHRVRRKTTAAAIRDAAQERFGWDTLRPGQLEAVQALLGGDDVLVVMPTGSGKSAVYQLAGLLIDGPTVVVSPLIALQRDQLAGLADRAQRHSLGEEGLEAVAVNSAQRASETTKAWESLADGDAEFVFLAPEQLANDTVVERLAQAEISLLAIDEAHCVSAWGHDFRPDYLRIGDVRERLGSPRVAALTATASPPVRAEIVERLRLHEPVSIIQGFDRPNLRLEVQRFTQAADKDRALIERVSGLDGCGLVYAATRKETERLATELNERGRRAKAYHAGLKAAEREQIHAEFHQSAIEIVVATTAFGMGIDKPDVRFVVHADISESVDSYYQEIGRAGRDGQPALAVLHYRPEDLGLRSFFASSSADEQVLSAVAGAIKRHTATEGRAEPSQLRDELEMSHTRLTAAVNLLEQAGAIEVDGEGGLHYADGRLGIENAVDTAEDVAQAHERIDRSRVDMIRGYAETPGCRRQFMLGYFGEQYPDLCGNCDTCSSGSAGEYAAGQAASSPPGSPGEGAAAEYPLESPVAHREWGNGVVMRLESDRITVLFEDVGYRTLSLRALEDDDGLLVRRNA